jgi:N-acyl amino acid synthase FeeM
MNYKVASTISEVIDAWCVVYKQYLAASLISPNEMSVFTFPEYISNNTAVILGNKMGHTVCTVSAVLDSIKGLPLDNYYKGELNQLRSENKKLIEIGLLADARGLGNLSSITDLMAGIARFGVYSNHHDYVIGVHPRRIKFFQKVFGFEPVGDIKDYGKLKTAPVVLLHAHGKDLEVISRKINAEIYYDPKDFDFSNRYQFNPDNFISDNEFNESVEVFIKNIWKTKTLQPA